MLSLNNDFIGYHPLEHNVEFSGSDSEKLYIDNLKLQPDDWYYRTHKISYVRNSNGHRCKEITDIDLDNYILYTGCSHTEGIGMKLEDTYPYLLSQKLKCDYYNLSIGGTGIDAVNYNLLMWFAKIKKPPKLLILQWPHHTRATTKFFENPHKLIPEPWYNYGIWSTKDTNNKNHKNIGNFLMSGEDIGFFKSLRILTKTLAYNMATCPIFELSTAYDLLNEGEYQLKQIDKARDISPAMPRGHLGIKSELINTNYLYQEASKLLNIAIKKETDNE
jgi:hypothetical protein